MARSWHRRARLPFTSSMGYRTRLAADQHLERGAASLRALGQGLFDAFCQDLDDSVREMGVGDLGVPRTMRLIGEAFYGRQAVYPAALDAPDDQRLAGALQRNVFAGSPQPGLAVWLALYVRE